MRRLRVFLLSGLVVAFFGGSPGSAGAAADPPNCDKFLRKETVKFGGQVAKRVQLCLDKLQIPPGGNIATGATQCEVQLDKALDFDANSGGKDSLSKYQAKVAQRFNGPTGIKCSGDADLGVMGHLLGGVNAPPVGGPAFEWYLIHNKVEAIFGALNLNVDASQTGWQLLYDSINDPASGVDCTGPSHPNLCTLHRDNPNTLNGYDMSTNSLADLCHLHECELVADPQNPPAASNFQVRLAIPDTTGVDGLDVVAGALDGSAIFKICKVVGVPRISTEIGGDYRVFGNFPTRTVKPAELDINTLVCIQGKTSAGWCDCTAGGGLANDYTQCSDHITGSGLSCPDTTLPNAVSEDEPCFCTTSGACGGLSQPACVSTGMACDSDLDCGATETCKARGGGGRCHPNSATTADLDFTGSSVTGDCLINSTTQLKVVNFTGPGSGICVSGELCDVSAPVCSIGPCIPFEGADGVPCTMDDNLPNGDPANLPLTTGSASATLEDAVYVEGTCPNGKTCIEDANCTNACNIIATEACDEASDCTGPKVCWFDQADPAETCTKNSQCKFCSTAGTACNNSGDCPATETCIKRGACSLTDTTLCNANSDCPATETCKFCAAQECDVVAGACTGEVIDRLVNPAIVGAPLAACEQLETSDLSGFTYVSSFVFVDGTGLGDGGSRSTFICE
jgi:hypothetical protein